MHEDRLALLREPAIAARDKRIKQLEQLVSVLFDHHLSSNEANDGEANAGQRDRLCQEIEEAVPTWRALRDQWLPSK